MKGIILAGGSGTQLYPATLAINKQLLPVFNKPMVYYPLSVLVLTGVCDICSSQRASPCHSTGACSATVRPRASSSTTSSRQPIIHPGARLHRGRSRRAYSRRQCVLRHSAELVDAAAREEGATVFAYYVSEPSQYGVVKFGDAGEAIDIVEKPTQFLSNWAVTGL